ncbi:hypothetical protein DFH07DRAFT_816877 [Mycena maculata]|uniref:MYND-type domain-containing protein n=1 Tax=Mycena maculata TaxID=230809 RepID=A0AAD7JA20_9AGAR|nr:hypothetical protein DFH07DRAFT_816877 [Mycena maculata]
MFSARIDIGGPITPLAQDKVKWNQDWEREIALVDRKPIDNIRIFTLHLVTKESKAELQHWLVVHRAVYGALCQALPRLAEASSFYFAIHDFANKWLSAPPAVREEHILEGLARACNGTGGDAFRGLCDELTLPSLQRDGGQGFLDLLKHFTLDDFSCAPQTPIYLESHLWYPADPPVEPREAYELADATFNVHRSWGIVSTLHETLESFHGVPPDNEQSVRPRGFADSQMSQLAKKLDLAAYGSRGAAKEWRQSYFPVDKALPHAAICENCRALETPGAQRFMRCKPCMENVSRKFYYCSRQCQREDWKLRHKQICGKPMTFKESEESAHITPPSTSPSASTSSRIGPAKDGFKRSPALLYQVNLLNESAPETDYIFVDSAQGTTHLNIHAADQKRAFRMFRDAALTTGSRDAVAAIGQFLVKPRGGAVVTFESRMAAVGGPIVQIGGDPQDVFDQLEREYGFDVKLAVQTLERKRGVWFTEVEKEMLNQGYPPRRKDVTSGVNAPKY